VVWLVILAAATRATADLVPSTRVSHLVYASIMLAWVWVVWISAHGRRLWHRPPAPEAGSEKRRG
jgi:uncharacterized protein involved in response to NO